MIFFKVRANYIIRSAVLTLAAVAMTACGEVHDPSEQDYRKSTRSIEAELTDASFSCADVSKCPSNVGMIYSESSSGLYYRTMGICSGFLVADNIVATNSHCIPESLKQVGGGCDGKMSIRFIRQDGGRNVFGCKRIIEFSDYKNEAADYAYFEVEPTGIPYLRISRVGVSERQSLLSMKVTPVHSSGEAHGGTLEVLKCSASINNAMNSRSTSRWSPVSTVVGCQAIKGNSGSVLVNESNEAVGVLQAYMDDLYLSILKVRYGFDAGLPDKFVPHGLFTNLSCVRHPGTQEPPRAECASAKELMLGDCAVTNSTTTSASFKEIQNSWARILPKNFLYRQVVDEQKGSVSAQPLCVLPGAPDLISEVTAMKIEPKASIHFDAEFRWLPGLVLKKSDQVMSEIQLLREAKVWRGSISTPSYLNPNSSTYVPLFGRPGAEKIELNVCSVQQIKAGHLQTSAGAQSATKPTSPSCL